MENSTVGGAPRTGSFEIMVNGKPRGVPAGASVGSLLDALGLKPGMIVVEYNREILPREGYGDVHLAPGDRLELVHFVGGG